ncbi:EamA family transporter [Notoacmeibacter sp. MSK16QG-6]|uniref:EamA family transporter n=1 Tax=Notoacmeibacter sp. MSK16QG-6 TaxID=2957982 RepID=UPI00209D19DE|nr:EamA family transporter [Notoacmeibacter sp. MSK16QG-6]MCP1199446.1 EamA family transporter [Notoacmeibacter sp. MSK16QG-6]
MPIGHILLAISVAAIYGFAFVAIRIGVDEIPPLLLTGYRYLFAAVPLIFFVPIPKIAWRWPIAFGLAQGAVMFGLLFMSIAFGLPPGLASVVVQMQVFFTIVFAAIFMKERVLPSQALGAVIALFGIVAIGVGRANVAPILPFVLCLASAAAWGVANMIAKIMPKTEPLPFVAWSSLAAPLPLFAASMLLEGTWFGIADQMPSLPVSGSIAFLAWPTTVYAFTAWVFLLRAHSAARVTPFALLIPVFGLSGAAIAFGEELQPLSVIGIALIFAGLAVNVFGEITGRRLRMIWGRPG